MGRKKRLWFRVGKHRSLMVLVDFETQTIRGCVEPTVREARLQQCWTPNQDELLHEFVATTREVSKSFPYDPHNTHQMTKAVTEAVDWVEERIGPPVKKTSRLILYLHLIQFWKYKPVLKGNKLIGLIPKKSGYTLDDFNKVT